MSTDKSGVFRTDLTSEHVMLAAMLAVASYMLIGSYDFSDSAAMFLRFTATITIVGVVLLLTRSTCRVRFTNTSPNRPTC
ncbi:hypothetical protein D8S78_23590 [Natrialba swarupiae]|nr:hypothetical protein [Natrialba swarupiae]